MHLFIQDNTVSIEFGWLENVLAHLTSFSFAVEHIAQVELVDRVEFPRFWLGFRKMFFIPFLVKIGIAHTANGKELWYSTWKSKQFLIIHLKEGIYKKLIFGTDEAEACFSILNQKVLRKGIS